MGKKTDLLDHIPKASSQCDGIHICYIEMLLQFLDSGALSMEEAFRFAYHTMEHGTKPALQDQLGIRNLNRNDQSTASKL